MERPFYERYPSRYQEKGGAPLFSKVAQISEQHENYLSEDSFPIVAQIRKYPRYTNKRIMDPQVKCFVDEKKITVPETYQLTVPNQAAAYKSLAKYGKSHKVMTEQQVHALNLAWEYTAQHFGLYMRDAKVLDVAEAISHLDMSTSSGAPFNLIHGIKRDLFGNDPELELWLEKDWDTLATDPNWSTLFSNSLKEETRLQEKLLENSQRTFLSGGVDAVVHGTRLFVDMNEKMYAAHLKTASAVGMSPYGGNWDEMVRRLSVFRKGYALDESQYDSSLRQYMMWGCARFRYTMLAETYRTPENLRRIQTYYRNLIHTLVITPEGVIVMKQLGNPSGSVNTISDNTLVLYTLMAYAWIRLSPEDVRSYFDFEANTSKVLVGDDNTWTVSDDAHDFYNATTVIEVWKELGITTTTDTLAPRKATELDFLSAHTVYIRGVAVPVYDRRKLMATLLYAPYKHITPATTLQRTAALLGVGWADPVFRGFCRALIDWLLLKYDHVLSDEPRWITAKTQIASDEKYCQLFTGKSVLVFYPQSVFRSVERSEMLNKNEMSSLPRKRNGTKPGKKTNQRKNQNLRVRVNRQRKGRKMAQVTVNRDPRPKQQLVLSNTKISECALLYGKVMVNPFDNTVTNPCIPDSICLPSYKYNSIAQGTFKIGTQGSGYVALNPWAMASTNFFVGGGFVDVPVISSTALYGATDYQNTDALVLGGFTQGQNCNTLLTYAQIQEGEMRLVAAGVEIYYTGPVLQQAGTVTCLQNDGLKTFPQGYTIETMRNNPRSTSYPVAQQTHPYVTYTPTNQNVMSYGPLSQYIPSHAGGALGGTNHPLLVFVTGATPGITFNYRVKAYFESQLPGMHATPSDSDIGGMGKILQAKCNLQQTSSPAADAKSTLFAALRSVGESVSRAAPVLGGIMGGVMGNAAMGETIGLTAKSVLSHLLAQ